MGRFNQMKISIKLNRTTSISKVIWFRNNSLVLNVVQNVNVKILIISMENFNTTIESISCYNIIDQVNVKVCEMNFNYFTKGIVL